MSNLTGQPQSEIHRKTLLEGDLMQKEEIAEKEISITDYIVLQSKFSDSKFAMVQAKLDDKLITFSVNNVMISQLREAKKEEFPCKVIVKKNEDHYWKFYWKC